LSDSQTRPPGMLSDEQYFAIKRRAASAFLKLPGVHSVGLGGRERSGQPTGEPVIKVFVLKKVPVSDLSPEHVIPATFEGVGTDIVGCGRDVLLSDPPPGGKLGTTFVDDGRYRPLRGGAQVQGANRRNPGTLGFLAQVAGAPNTVMAVTVHHALFEEETDQIPNMKVGQPTPDESMTGCCSSVFGKFAAGHFDSVPVQPLDAAVIRLDPGTKWLAEIKNIGPVRGKNNIDVLQATSLKYHVRKRGIATLVTGGIVQAIGVEGTDGQRSWNNGIRVKPNPNPSISGPITFGDFGDSGAALVNDADEIVAVLFAGTRPPLGDPVPPDQPELGWGPALPIADLLARFGNDDGINLVVATATDVGDVREVPRLSADDADATVPTEAPAFVARLEGDLVRSARGRLLLQLWLRHSIEVSELVRTNPYVAARWRRNEGPALVQALIRAAADPDRALPVELGGSPVDERVTAIADVLGRYGSAELRADIERCRAALPRLSGRSYQEIVEALGDPDDVTFSGMSGSGRERCDAETPHDH
jgi:hypothetical protein